MGTRTLLSAIAGKFTARVSPGRLQRRQFFDTFDWRLYHKNLILLHDGEEYRLADLRTNGPVQSFRAPGGLKFWWDWPEGIFRDRLRDILEARAVLPLGEMEIRVRTVSILNSNEKTVVRARIEEGRGLNTKHDTGRIRTVKIVPLKGYGKDEQALSSFLEKLGLSPAAKNSIDIVAEANGRRPGDYSSKLNLELEHSMTGQEAAGVIFRRLLAVMECNVRGILEDIDTEFLHDFRVAVRRTRSGLSQIKGVLPKAISDRYGIEFADVGRGTSRLRDLDVYLLNRDRFLAMLSGDLAPALDPFFEELASERSKEHDSVVRLLSGARYKELVKNWKAVLARCGSPELEAERARAAVGETAGRMITRRYRRVLDRGSRIDKQSPDTDLHTLRISCKKLRYLLEFFASLYPAGKMQRLIKQLKKLQDNLGEFNDLSVQQADLRAFLEMPSARRESATSAAIGTLIARLEDRRHQVRGEFADVFRKFASPENADDYRKLFRIKRG